MIDFHENDVILHSMQRAQLEVELARALLRFFNAQPQIRYLRNLLETALTTIVADLDGAHRNVAQKGLFDLAVRSAGNGLALWRNYGVACRAGNLRPILGQVNNWSAADCSDLIRLFGGLVEHRLLRGGTGYQAIDPALSNEQDSWRPAPHFNQPPRYPGPRARVRNVNYEAAQSALHVGNAHAVMIAQRVNEAGFSGTERTRLDRNRSTVFKIDYVYGLPEGADISGTTADSLFFHNHLEPFCETNAVPPWMFLILHLLPIATMVSQAHHTILECALTMSVNRRTGIEYSVGKYTTLLQPVLRDRANDVGVGVRTVRNILEHFENDWRNHRMFCYFDPLNFQVRSRYCDSLLEWPEFHRISTFSSNGGLLNAFRLAQPPMTHVRVRNLFVRCITPGTWLAI